jgi:PAS domain S-box-containing protein
MLLAAGTTAGTEWERRPDDRGERRLRAAAERMTGGWIPGPGGRSLSELLVLLFDAATSYAIITRDRTKEKEAADRLSAAEGVVRHAREMLTAERALSEVAEGRWRVLFDQMQEGFFVAEAIRSDGGSIADFRLLELNPSFERITGLSARDVLGRPLTAALPGAQELIAKLAGVVLDGGFAQHELCLDASGAWVKVRLSRTGSDRVVGLMLDISDSKTAEAALREETETLETLNRSAVALAGEFDADRIIRIVTDAGVALTGAEFGAFFYEARDGEQLSYTRLANAHVPRELFLGTGAGKGGEDGGATGTEPDGAHRAGASAAGRVSRLSIPIMSRTGDRLARLYFAHRQADALGDRTARLLAGLAGHAAVALDNARLFQAAQREIEQRQRVEGDLRELNETLEQRIEQALAERDYAEDQLRQAQKMEAIGQLTGGIAHDFNNLLTVVSGNIDMVRRTLERGHPDERLARAIQNALRGVERAAALTQRLLAFARRQPLQPAPLDVNRLIAGMSDLLRRSLSETIELDVQAGEDLWLVEADPNQLENALLNLAVNASDAMPDGGRLTVATSNRHVEAPGRLQRGGVTDGDYVLITVSDSGTGMSEEVLANAFDPFYTTKQVGKGTGLGLSQVYGFVKQSGGHVKISSRLGEGTTVSIYLPRLDGDRPAVLATERAPVEAEGAGEAILVVEDDEDVRRYTVDSLAELGYRVVEARDGATALERLATDAEDVRLLLTDVVMPAMSGRELADRALAIRRELRVLFTTGYPRDAIVHDGRVDPDVALLSKPFSFAELATKVRELLDR